MYRSALSRSRRPILVGFVATTLAACSPPQPPDEERRPEPRAVGTPAQPTSGVVQTAKAYKDVARAAVASSEHAAAKEKAELEAATR